MSPTNQENTYLLNSVWERMYPICNYWRRKNVFLDVSDVLGWINHCCKVKVIELLKGESTMDRAAGGDPATENRADQKGDGATEGRFGDFEN